MACRAQGALLVWLSLALGACSLLFEVEETPGTTHPLRVWAGNNASHTCLSRDNKLLCWGANYEGQLGLGHTETIGDDEAADMALSPTEFPDDIQQVSMSEHHTCALTTAGELYCWGRAEGGVLGFGDLQNVSEMISEAGALRTGGTVQSVALGDQISCFLRSQEVVCLGAGNAIMMVALHGFSQDQDFGDDEFPQEVEPAQLGGNVSELAVGTAHACVVLESGDIQCWGENGFGELGNGKMSAETLAAPQGMNFGLRDLALGHGFGCGIDADKKVRCWGRSNSGQQGVAQTDSVPYFEDMQSIDFDEAVSKVVAGDEHACAMYGQPGKVQCWGQGAYGAIGRESAEIIGDDELVANKNPLGLEAVVDVAAGRDHTCAVLDTDEVVCWGLNRGAFDGTGVLGWGLPCVDLEKAADGACAYGDEVGESVTSALRLRFDM